MALAYKRLSPYSGVSNEGGLLCIIPRSSFLQCIPALAPAERVS